MLSAAWNNPAGGLRYHLRAFRNSQRAWQPFREGLERWLAGWKPNAETLAIVGPSAGYCLPVRALQQFQRFVIFEPDPVARFILKRRLARALPGRAITWVAHDAWIDPVRRGDAIPRALLGPGSALLFSNIIGQLPYLMDSADYPEWRKLWCQQLFPQLERTPWASFHDRVSSENAPPGALPAHAQQLTNEELKALYEPAAQALVELYDHGSHELLPLGNSYQYLHWPLTPSMHHLIECVLGGP